MFDIISINRPLAVHLLGLAQRAPSGFICGYIGAVNGELKSCYPINPDSDKIEAKQALRMEMEKNNETLFAYFETLEEGQNAPELGELTALEKGVYFLGISLDIKGVLELAAFELEDNQVSSVDLVI